MSVWNLVLNSAVALFAFSLRICANGYCKDYWVTWCSLWFLIITEHPWLTLFLRWLSQDMAAMTLKNVLMAWALGPFLPLTSKFLGMKKEVYSPYKPQVCTNMCHAHHGEWPKCYWHSCFTGKEIEVQRGKASCLGSHSWLVEKMGCWHNSFWL